MLIDTCSENQDLELFSVTYQDLKEATPSTLETLKAALKTDGAVAISEIPNFDQKLHSFFIQSIDFFRQPDCAKENVIAGGVETTWSYLGLDKGAEVFTTDEGKKCADIYKESFYFTHPDIKENKWPNAKLRECALDLSSLIHNVGGLLFTKIGLIGKGKPVESLEGGIDVGRLLHYSPTKSEDPNPFWCGQHADHGLFTGLVNAKYFQEGVEIRQPKNAGLHIKKNNSYQKISAVKNSIIFQVGELAQLLMNDEIVATMHRVDKPNPPVRNLERYTFALFVNPDIKTPIDSDSILTKQDRYKKGMTFEEWHIATLNRYATKK